MKTKERHTKLIEIIRKKNAKSTVEELADILGFSRETIRRDLTIIAKTGIIQKVHGGAILPKFMGEGGFQQRMSTNIDAKLKIAKYAANLILPHQTLFIDTGSTTIYFAEQLSNLKNLTIITNSTEIARITSLSHHEAYLLGGKFATDNRQTTGAMACKQIKEFRAHHAILTIGALDSKTGVMDFNILEAQIANCMIEQAELVTILIDSSKFNTIASFEVCSLLKINHLISDKPPPENILKILTKNKCRIHIV